MNRLIDIAFGASLMAIVTLGLMTTGVLEVRPVHQVLQYPPVNCQFQPCDWPPRLDLDRGPPSMPKEYPFQDSH